MTGVRSMAPAPAPPERPLLNSAERLFLQQMEHLYISDIDGTLLSSSETLSEYSRTELNRLIDSGLLFSVASARSIVSMQHVLAGLRLRLPVIELNGAFITDFTTGRHLAVHAVQPALAPEVLRDITTAGCSPFVSTYDGEHDCLYHETISNSGMESYYRARMLVKDRRLRPACRLSGVLHQQIMAFTVIDEEERLRQLGLRLQQSYGALLAFHLIEDLYTGWFWLEVHDHRATKGQAIVSLTELAGCADHPLTVFGDNLNDIHMFELAGRPIAVSNAHREIKERAALLIGSNDADSVVRFISREFTAAV